MTDGFRTLLWRFFLPGRRGQAPSTEICRSCSEFHWRITGNILDVPRRSVHQPKPIPRCSAPLRSNCVGFGGPYFSQSNFGSRRGFPGWTWFGRPAAGLLFRVVDYGVCESLQGKKVASAVTRSRGPFSGSTAASHSLPTSGNLGYSDNQAHTNPSIPPRYALTLGSRMTRAPNRPSLARPGIHSGLRRLPTAVGTPDNIVGIHQVPNHSVRDLYLPNAFKQLFR